MGKALLKKRDNGFWLHFVVYHDHQLRLSNAYGSYLEASAFLRESIEDGSIEEGDGQIVSTKLEAEYLGKLFLVVSKDTQTNKVGIVMCHKHNGPIDSHQMFRQCVQDDFNREREIYIQSAQTIPFSYFRIFVCSHITISLE